MKIHDIIAFLEEEFPISYQESYDNCGIQVGNPDHTLTQGLICLDITEEVLEESISKNCNLIISHHPLIFKGIKKITGQSPTERIITKAIQHNINIYSLHTNLDNHINGLNGNIAQKLNLRKYRVLQSADNLLKKLVVFCPLSHADKVRTAIFDAGAGSIGNYDACSFNVAGKGSFRGNEASQPFVGNKNQLHIEEEIRIETIFPAINESKIITAIRSNHPYEEVAFDIYKTDNPYPNIGAGIIGEIEEAISTPRFFEQLKEVFGTQCIRHNTISKPQIKTIAYCGGSGAFLINQAIRGNADIYITGDIKYHEFFENRIIIADIGHYESEQFSIELIAKLLMKKFHTFAFLISDTKTNPVNYF